MSTLRQLAQALTEIDRKHACLMDAHRVIVERDTEIDLLRAELAEWKDGNKWSSTEHEATLTSVNESIRAEAEKWQREYLAASADAMKFAERLQGMKIEAQEWAEAAAMAAKGSMAILKENEALRNTLREIKSLPASYGLQHAKNLAKAALGKKGGDELGGNHQKSKQVQGARGDDGAQGNHPTTAPSDRRHGIYEMPDGSRWHSGTGLIFPKEGT